MKVADLEAALGPLAGNRIRLAFGFKCCYILHKLFFAMGVWMSVQSEKGEQRSNDVYA